MKDDIDVEREAKMLGKVSVDREFIIIENKKKDLEEQISYV